MEKQTQKNPDGLTDDKKFEDALKTILRAPKEKVMARIEEDREQRKQQVATKHK